MGVGVLTLVCGLPNAGKTTGYPDALHADEIGGYENVADAVSQLTGDVTVEGIFPRSEGRALIRSAYRGAARCIWMDVPIDTCRGRGGRPAYFVDNVARMFEPPTYAEGWDEIEVIL